MRYRITFLAGFAAGYVAGARAGRERYEQIMRLGRRAAENPAVRQAADTVSTTATELAKSARDKATEKMPKFAETAINKASASRDRFPGRRARANSAPAYPAAGSPGPQPSRQTPGTSGYPDGT
ncbi:MAG TPA: hypothetical protein VE733_06120 [Streptosporangiaceae bacterium]|nr:hypothetical protein [Streptosporangiaceae bacterium]